MRRSSQSAKLVVILLAGLITIGIASPAEAISFGGPGGKWPKSWPKQLEPFRKQAWTWEHGFGGISYDIPFADRDEFESVWPHILKLKSKGASILLWRGPHVRVKKARTAGVRIMLPRPGVKEGPLSVTRIMLVVDGKIVDLNRIRLPDDSPVIDNRFSGK